MFFRKIAVCLSKREEEEPTNKPSPKKPDRQETTSEDTTSGKNSNDHAMQSRSNKFGLQTLQKDRKLALLSDRLKTYTGLYSDESGDELNSQKKSNFRTKFDANKFDKQVLDLKDKALKRADWVKILKNNDLESTPTADLLTSLRYGAPSELRPAIWKFLTNVEKNKKEYVIKSMQAPDYYFEVSELKCQDPEVEKQINLDTPRTFPKNPLFSDKSHGGEEILFRILRAYANHDPEIGYTQGMNFLVGALLIIMHPKNYEQFDSSKPDLLPLFAQLSQGFCRVSEEEYEEDVFWILIHIMEEKNWRSIYKPKFPKVYEMCKYLEKLIQTQAKEVYDVFKDIDASIFELFHQAFITLMTMNAPLELAKRIFDVFFIEGERMVFKVLIRAITLSKNRIFELDTAMELHEFIKNEMFAELFSKYKKKLYVLFPFSEGEDF